MIREVKELEFECDGCGLRVVQKATFSLYADLKLAHNSNWIRTHPDGKLVSLPPNWKRARVKLEYMSTVKIYCPCCLRKGLPPGAEILND